MIQVTINQFKFQYQCLEYNCNNDRYSIEIFQNIWVAMA